MSVTTLEEILDKKVKFTSKVGQYFIYFKFDKSHTVV